MCGLFGFQIGVDGSHEVVQGLSWRSALVKFLFQPNPNFTVTL